LQRPEHTESKPYQVGWAAKIINVYLKTRAYLAWAAPRSTTDWPQHIQRLRAIGYDGTITLEVFAPQKEYLLLSRDLLR
jgi:hypothetical protein